MLERAGLIENIRTQQSIYLTAARIQYIVDFAHFEKSLGEDVFDEFKGFDTPEWRLKLKLWKFYGPGLLRVYRQDSRTKRIYLDKEIRGQGMKECSGGHCG